MLFPKKKIIIGAANFGYKYGFVNNPTKIDSQEIIKIGDLCSTYGVTKIDTAMDYNGSEKIIGKTLNNYDVTTKIKYLSGTRNEIKSKILFNVNRSLSRLKTSQIYCLMLHDPLQLTSSNGRFIFKVLNSLKDRGLIKKIGISVYDQDLLEKIISTFDIDVVQFPCNYLNQSFLKTSLISKLKKKNIEIQARSIFLQGYLINNDVKKNQYLKKWSKLFLEIEKWHKENKISKLESCLSFISSIKYLDGFVIGVENANQLKSILKIDEVKKPKKYFPQSFDRYLTDTRFWKKNNSSENDKGQILWKKASNIILNGNMLFSKKPELFLPNKWPPYFHKAKGCKIWDISGKKYTDFSLMGVGTNILGYAAEKVDSAVKKVIKLGTMSTLNCPEEVQLGERLIELHPWAKKVKFARSGGEASAISIRIGRAASGKDNIAFCGYHGWHDWYLSANLSGKDSLDGHLLPGLNPKGVSKSLKNTIFPFKYNDFLGLKKIIDQKEIGIVKMEVSRNNNPKNNFLQKIRNICDQKGIVLIFDECSSGFRQTFGGLHKLYNVNPDIATFGKALGNGYPITAVIGKEEIMGSAKDSFISSTFWSDRIGPTAALATLDEMSRIKSWSIITKKGIYLRKKWILLAKKYDLDITIYGIPALSSFSINSGKFLEYKTFITQELLKKGIMASNLVIFSVSHSSEIIEKYLYELDKIFKIIGECEKGRNIYQLLEHPLSATDFKRLN